MQTVPYEILGFVSLCALGLAALSAALGQERMARVLALLGCLSCSATLANVVLMENRFPLHGTLEGFSEIALIVSLLGLARSLKSPGGPLPAWTWSVSTVLLALTWAGAMKPIADGHLLDYPWLVMFFQGRLVAVSLLLYASLHAVCSLSPNTGPDAGLAQARNFLVLGCAFFLGAEFSGCQWALNMAGDYWRWNNVFLQSTMMFLLATLALHIPLLWSRRPRTAAWLTALPGLVITGLVVWSQLWAEV